ncbi:non-ribosomal peptide synthetase [Flavobacterium notoginsengisoli]|uniref:non-ribosomal peptide synthetase n=1 Tax=Flavobacterium notoginsengisoli TaxID=1478199 RepID=UPI003626652F
MRLAAIWQDLLGVEKVGIHDNFFELGGHSLLVVQLISRLQKNDFHITVQDIFESPTVASMSGKLSSLSVVYRVPANGIIPGCNCITPSMIPLVDLSQDDLDKIIENIAGGVSNIQDIYPLSPLQQGIHFHYLMSDDTHGDPYILPSLLSFSDKEKRDTFIKALQFVVNRHDVLRTCILSEGLPHAVQVVLREVSLSADSLELDASKDILSQIELMIAPGGHWMDLSKAPLLQLKLADDQQHDCYYLVLYQHHLILDHVGLEKIVGEVGLYLSGEESSLPIPVLYRDFIGHTLHSQSVNNGETYFRSLFGVIQEPTYPFNISGVLGNGSGIEESKVLLSRELSTELRHFCIRLGVTPAVLFHAAYGLVIGRCSNKEYAVFGSLFSGRLQGSVGAADSIGLFINTLPLFLELKGSLGEYLKQVKDGLQDVLSYEQTPLSQIHHWSGISNDVPLFSAILNYRHSTSLPSSGQESDTVLGMKILAGHEWTNYPFTFSVDDYGTDFGLTAQVDLSIGSDRIISYMEQALIGLTEGINLEETGIQSLDILSNDEKHQLLDVFNATGVDYPLDRTVVDLFEEQVVKSPDAIAVVFEGEQLSYRELDERSNQLAHYLCGRGVVADTLVGICLERSVEMLVGILGILKSSGAYVPIDPEYPVERIGYMLEDAAIQLVLSSSASHAALKEHPVSVLLLDDQWDLICGHPSGKPDTVLLPHNLAYVIYTSGSTGRPKGVSIMHKSLANFLLSMTDQLEMKDLKSFLSVTTYTFDIFYLELFVPLLLGAKVIMLDNMIVRDADALRSAIANFTPDFMQATPSTWQMLVDSGWRNNEQVVVLVGGEAIKESLKDSLTVISETVWNLYGPTEATIWVTAQKLKHLEKVIIGKAIDNVQLYILGTHDAILPRGVVGELCIGGVQLAKGYLNQEELTQQKFIVNPFKEGDRLYKTGDLARWLPDGSVDLLGRKDDQVKIRGHRIELGEIENALSSLSGVIQCCVLAKEDVSGNKRLVGYVVMEDVLDKKILQEALKENLPEYMVPMIWVELKELPLTSNGKLNKKALPDYDSAELSTCEYAEPRTETEHQLVAIWQDLLGVEKVGIYDNFFELGGHSLLATQLVSVIRRELSIETSIRNIFKFTTVEDLASYIDYKIRKLDNETNEYSISINI